MSFFLLRRFLPTAIRLISLIVCVLMSVLTLGYAQVTTSITPTQGVGNLGTQVGTATTLANGKINYDITGGTRPSGGANLFHSFGQFNIGANNVANFLNESGLATKNIMSRVTGGNPSQIFGTIQTTGFPGAHLYLMNPAGVLFGPTASLNVEGSFHVTTADYLRLADNVQFLAKPNVVKDSLLSTAPVAAFGFLSNTPAPISVQGGALQVPTGQTLSLVGGNIEITAQDNGDPLTTTDILAAASGRINLASVASPGEVILNSPGTSADLTLQNFTQLGAINVSQDASLSVVGDPGGTVFIRGGRFVLDQSVIAARSEGSTDHPGTAVDIAVSGDITLRARPTGGAEIGASSFAAGNAGNIRLAAENIQLTGDAGTGHNANIGSRSFGTAADAGDGGTITITAKGLVRLEDSAFIQTTTFGPGNSKNITIDSARLELVGTRNSAFIATGATRAAGNGGNLQITTGSLQLIDGASLNTSTSGTGRAGNIEVKADSLFISGTDQNGFAAGIFASTTGAGRGTAGDITITGKDLTLSNFGQISAFSGSFGNSGSIHIQTDNLTVTNGAFVTSTNFGAGAAGNITINNEGLMLLQGPTSPAVDFTTPGIFSIGGVFSSRAGDITVKTGSLQILDGAMILARTNGPGRGGTIDITADRVVIGGTDPNLFMPEGTASGIYASTLIFGGFFTQAKGDAGNVRINARDLEIRDQGKIEALSGTRGKGGDIAITADQIQLTNGAAISAISDGTGNAGTITIDASTQFLSTNGSVTTRALQSDGGNIDIHAGTLVRLGNSSITTSVGTGAGNGGNINIDPQFVILQDSQIRANAFGGNGGNITITSGIFLADPSSIVSASSTLGVNGTIDIQSPVQNLSGSLSPLPSSLLKITPLTSACAARAQGGSMSSFTVAGRDGIPAEPGGLLPSPLSQASLSLTGGQQGATYSDPGLPIPLLLSMDWEKRCG